MSRCGECKLGCNEEGALYCEEDLAYEQCIDTLQDALYAVDRPQGEWIEENGCVICSECRWNALRTMTGCFMDRHLDYNKSNFCPHCGARMKGAEDG